MDSQQFCVRWNSYQSNLQNAFPKLLTHEHFVDVTLACEAQSVKCHKVVLSACSAYFEKLLVQNPCQHPIIFMKDMKYWEVQALVDFMYKGEVNVHQDKLSSLLKAAEALQIKGLCGPDQDSSTSATASSDSVNLPQDTTVSDGRETPPSYKRRRTRPTEDSEDHLPAVIQRPPQGQLPPQVVQKSVPLNDSGLKRKSELAVTIPPSVTLQPPLPKPAPPASQPSPSVSSSLPPEQELPTKSDPLQDVMLPSERVKEEVITLDDMQDDQSDSRLDDDYGLVQQDESNSMMHEDTSSLDQPGPSGLASFAQIAMDKTVSEHGDYAYYGNPLIPLPVLEPFLEKQLQQGSFLQISRSVIDACVKTIFSVGGDKLLKNRYAYLDFCKRFYMRYPSIAEPGHPPWASFAKRLSKKIRNTRQKVKKMNQN